MAKVKSLNGLPNNLLMSFFDTIRYYKCGYMADWLINGASKLGITEVTVDIIKARVDSPKLNLYPIIWNLHEIKPIIEKELKGNGFPNDFIIEAKINMKFPVPDESKRVIYCYPFLIYKNGHKYSPGLIIETAYEKEFDPFDDKNLYPQGQKEEYFERLNKRFGDNLK